MKVYILTEGGRNIGLGHIARCSALYDAFVERRIMPTFLVNIDASANKMLSGRQYRVMNWLLEESGVFEILTGADIVIVDSYLAGLGLYKKIASLVKVPAYIDDNKRLRYPDGIVINGSIYAERIGYRRQKGVTYLLGVKYMPLRREFWDVPPRAVRVCARAIMVTFGGDDMRNMTAKIVRCLRERYPALTQYVIIGDGCRDKAGLLRLSNAKTRIIVSPDARAMKRVMLSSDMAVSAGGQTLYELARTGLPTVAVAIADNQLNNVNGWRAAGFIRYAGWYRDAGLLSKVTRYVDELSAPAARRSSSEKGRSRIDAKGAGRIVDALIARAGKRGRA